MNLKSQGSEGTLAFTTQITLKLDDLPPKEGVMVAAHFKSIENCLKAVAPAMQHNLFTCEMMDKTILDCTKRNATQQENRSFIEGDPEAILMCEVRAETIEDAKTKAEEVLKKVQAGGNFEQLAKKYSEDEASKVKGGLLGDFHPGSTIPEIAESMVKLNEGETSNIINSSFGHHILKLDEIMPSVLIPFKDAQSDILNALMKRETKKLFKEYVVDLEKTAKIEIFI